MGSSGRAKLPRVAHAFTHIRREIRIGRCGPSGRSPSGWRHAGGTRRAAGSAPVLCVQSRAAGASGRRCRIHRLGLGSRYRSRLGFSRASERSGAQVAHQGRLVTSAQGSYLTFRRSVVGARVRIRCHNAQASQIENRHSSQANTLAVAFKAAVLLRSIGRASIGCTPKLVSLKTAAWRAWIPRARWAQASP